MSNEFKQIEKASLYEIDKEGYIQTIAKQSPMIPHPRGSRTVILKTNDGIRKYFNIDELVAESFGKTSKKNKLEDIQASEDERNTITAPETIHEEEKSPSVKITKSKDKKTSVIDNLEVEKIMKLDCYDSVKMWKLHNIGISKTDITLLLKQPHDFVVCATIKKYKKNLTLRERADKVKV